MSPQTTPLANTVHTNLATLTALQHRAHGFSLLPRQPIHSLLAGRHASRLRGRGLNFDEIRRYQPGDDIRQIDWKVTARTRKTHTRIFTEERERTTLLVVDQRVSMFFGSVRSMKSVTAAEFAALSAWRVLSQKDRVGALIFNDTRIDEIRPARSRSAVMRILGTIVAQNNALNISAAPHVAPAQFNAALRRCENLATHDCLVAIISDGAGHDDDTRRILTRIARHNDVIFIFIHDPLEAALPAADPLLFSDGTRELEIDTNNRRLRDTYASAFTSTRATGRAFLLQRETPIIPLSTALPVRDQLRKLLGARLRK